MLTVPEGTHLGCSWCERWDADRQGAGSRMEVHTGQKLIKLGVELGLMMVWRWVLNGGGRSWG
jgi:hypothetical protein